MMGEYVSIFKLILKAAALARVELEHLKIETRLTSETPVSEMGESM